MQLGQWECFPVETGLFRLDGGAMFGNVPKVLWEKSMPADEFNRIVMALRTLLLKKGDQLILVDTGMGHKWSDKELVRYALDYSKNSLQNSFKQLGYTFEDVTDVILTHLHFDHAGGATCYKGDKLVPTFSNARYYVQQDNLKTAKSPNIRERVSYLPQNFQPLIDHNVLEVIDGDIELFPDIKVKRSYGHTLGMQTVSVISEGEALYYCADLIPTSSHVSPAYTMGYDIQPVVVIEEKITFLNEIENTNGILFYEHDPQVAASRLTKDKRGRHCAGEVVLTS